MARSRIKMHGPTGQPPLLAPQQNYAPRYDLAQALLREGTSTAPVATHLQGLARLAQAGLGGYQMRRVREEEEAERQARAQALSSALDIGELPEGVSRKQALTERLMSNPYTAEYGMQLALADALDPERDKFEQVTDVGLVRIPAGGGAPSIAIPAPREDTFGFGGTSIDAQTYNALLRREMGKWHEAHPDATPEQAADAQSQLMAALSERHQMTPQYQTYVDPVYGPVSVARPPTPLPTFESLGLGAGASPVSVQRAPMQQPPRGAGARTIPLEPRTAPEPNVLPGAAGSPVPEEVMIDRFGPGYKGVWKHNGQIEVTRQPTESEKKAGGWAQRMTAAELDEFVDPETQEPTQSGLMPLESNPETLRKITSFPEQVLSRQGTMTYGLLSEPMKQYLQYARNWIQGLLRYESGAAVPEVEFWRYFDTFFAGIGDSDAVIAQKRRARLYAAEQLATVSGVEEARERAEQLRLQGVGEVTDEAGWSVER